MHSMVRDYIRKDYWTHFFEINEQDAINANDRAMIKRFRGGEQQNEAAQNFRRSKNIAFA